MILEAIAHIIKHRKIKYQISIETEVKLRVNRQNTIWSKPDAKYHGSIFITSLIVMLSKSIIHCDTITDIYELQNRSKISSNQSIFNPSLFYLNKSNLSIDDQLTEANDSRLILNDDLQQQATSDNPANEAVKYDEPRDSYDGSGSGKGEAEVGAGASLFDDDLWDDDEFDEDAGDEDAEDFYMTNPLDQKTSSYNDLSTSVKVKDADFQNEFYTNSRPLDKSVINPLKTVTNDTQSTKDMTSDKKTSSSWQRPTGFRANQVLATQANCAVMLSRGICIDYRVIELAVRQARRVLRYRRPGDLGALEPRESSIDAVGELNEWTTRILAQQYGLSWDEVSFELDQVDMSRTSMWSTCPLIFRRGPNCLGVSRFRTHTGQCNNLLSPNIGAFLMPFARMLPPQYNDQVGFARLSSTTSGNPLPPARIVALNLHPDVWSPSQDFSVLFMAWGQLLNHDMAMASQLQGKPCCGYSYSSRAGVAPRPYRSCLPIGIPPGDPVYGRFGVRCHEFRRTPAALRPGCTLGPRTQLNTVTSFVDASFVYGSSRRISHKIRAHKRGLLRSWNYFGRSGLKPLMPPQTGNPDQECVGRSSGRYCFLSGDARTNQHIQLAALHTVYVRQHNRLALALGQLNPHWSDDRIYHEARHIQAAQVQHIMLDEYLPALLGPDLCEQYNLTEAPLGAYWDHYEPARQPSISQAFAASAFRQGHSTVPGEVFRFNVLHEPTRMYKLRDLFRQPWPLFEPGAMDEFLLGTVDAPAQERDPFISLELSGHLLKEPNDPIGHDLASINIQRGRDQGVAGYNAFREWCGLGRLGSFDDLIGPMSNRTAELMATLYENVDDIDLFPGGISEFPLDGAQVGPTFACIIGQQFQALRFGDRYWFESSMGPHAFTLDQLASIKQVPLARILCANSDNMQTIQSQALRLAHPVLNPRVHCAQLPELDLRLWYEHAPANWSPDDVDDFK